MLEATARHSTIIEMPAHEFARNASPQHRSYIQRLAAATIPIFNNEGNFVGNGVAISSALILIPADFAQGKHLYIKIPEKRKNPVDVGATVIFGKNPDLFRVLAIDIECLQPIPLGTAKPCKQDIQMHCDPKAYVPIVTHPHTHIPLVNDPHTTAHNRSPPLSPRIPNAHAGNYAYAHPPLAGDSHPHVQNRVFPLSPRSLAMSQLNMLGATQESGAPSMSLKDGKVYAILRYGSTRLNVLDIYKCLKEAANIKIDDSSSDDDITSSDDDENEDPLHGAAKIEARNRKTTAQMLLQLFPPEFEPAEEKAQEKS